MPKNRKPYLDLKAGLSAFYSAPVRYLKESNEKESQFEKPYLVSGGGEYRKIQLDIPEPNWPTEPSFAVNIGAGTSAGSKQLIRPSFGLTYPIGSIYLVDDPVLNDWFEVEAEVKYFLPLDLAWYVTVTGSDLEWWYYILYVGDRIRIAIRTSTAQTLTVYAEAWSRREIPSVAQKLPEDNYQAKQWYESRRVICGSLDVTVEGFVLQFVASLGSGTVSDMVVGTDGYLYAVLLNLGGSEVHRSSNGSSWSNISAAAFSSLGVSRIAEHSGSIYVTTGDYFDVETAEVYKYNSGTSWTGQGVLDDNYIALGICSDGTDLWAGGNATGAGANNGIYRYVPGWTNEGNPGGGQGFYELTNHGGVVFAPATGDDHVYSWNGSGWDDEGNPGGASNLYRAVSNGSDFYVATNASGKVYKYVAAGSWSAMGSGFSGTNAYALCLGGNGDLYASSFSDANLRRLLSPLTGAWETSTGGQASGYISSCRLFNGAIYVGTSTGNIYKYTEA